MISQYRLIRLATFIATLIAALAVSCVEAATCNVPTTSYPTIQAAIDDTGCTQIVLATGTFSEAPVIDRALQLQGDGSTRTFIEGRVEVSAGTVHIEKIHITAPTDALWVHSGAEVSGFDLEVVNGLVESPLFADGFEDGTTHQWSSVSP